MPSRRRKPRPPRPVRPFGAGTLYRIFFFHQRLCQQESVNASVLARELGVSRRTIARDRDILANLGAPIAWDAIAGTYCYTRRCDALPFVRIEPEEAFALAMAAAMFSHAPEVPLGPAFASSLEKLKPVLGGVVSFPIDEVGRAVSAPPLGADELRHIGPLLEATLQHAELQLLYRKPHAAAAERRTVHPLRLVPHEQLWTLIAYDLDRRALRHFVLTRIVELARTGHRFRPPPGIDVDAHVRGMMGRFGATEEHEVRLALDEHAAFYARERPWHSGQTLTPRPDGRHELALRVNNIVDVQTQILRWSGHVEVLAPDALRALVIATLRAALESNMPRDAPSPAKSALT